MGFDSESLSCDATLQPDSLSAKEGEMILAQEQGANMRAAGRSKEIEAEFGFAGKEGTLVLTNKRLIFVCTDEKGEDLPIGYYADEMLLYSEVEDLDAIPVQAPNIFIPLEGVSAKGHKEGLGRPSLEVSWHASDGDHDVIFTETLTDWAAVIQKIKDGSQKLATIPGPPSTDTLEGKILHVMADMQEKGLLEIEEDAEGEYSVDLDPDDVQAACDRLSSQGILLRHPDSSGDVYYRRVSPLGEEDLSS
jgi:hypothetical protein